MSAVLELNDAGILVHQDGAELLESPGYLACQDRQVYVGTEAAERVKLIPTQTEYSFWEKFGTDPLQISLSAGRTQADLAYRHLEHLWSIVGADLDRLVLCVPGDFKREQLALLLGMCRRLKMPVKALLDTAVAVSANPVPGRRLFHLDLHLHRCVLSALEQGPWLTREAVGASHEFGLLRLGDAWSHAIAALFVQNTRFDPLHEASSEQQLFDHLPGWLSVLNRHDHVDLELERDERRYQVRVSRRALLRAAEPLYRRLRQFVADQLPDGQPVTLQVSHRLGQLPGCLNALEALSDSEVVVLDRLAAGQGVRRLYLERAGDSDEAPYVTRLPWFNSDDVASHAERLAGYRQRPATHVLHRAVAYPLANGEFFVGAELKGGEAGIGLSDGHPGVAAHHFRLRREAEKLILEDLSGGAMAVNDEPFEGRREVGIGDRIRIGQPGTEFLLISVEGDGGGA